jgi:hypothetical protein
MSLAVTAAVRLLVLSAARAAAGMVARLAAVSADTAKLAASRRYDKTDS